MQIADKYSPQEIEQKWYDYWIDNRLFHSEPDGREPYTIVIPPPNVTGMLHMGHMLNNTLQDVLIRRARMSGKNACWVPGMDHASIATEAKVVAMLHEKGIEKSSLSREEFLEYAWEWKEKYGGMILSPWLDRPLSVAGRVFVAGKDGKPEVKLVNLKKDLLIIPNVAIHFNREINNGFAYNPQTDMAPLMGLDQEFSIKKLCAEAAGVAEEEILGSDLYVYNRDKGRIMGADDSLIGSPRLDDLQCAYATLRGFLASKPEEFISVYALFDNEEVGSGTKQGADSTFLEEFLEIVLENIYPDKNRLWKRSFYQNSFLLSADNGHAVHPNHPEKTDPTNRPYLNGGVVLKYNGSQKYTTDGYSAAIVRQICNTWEIPLQTFANRSDIAGGSTLGNISTAHVSIPSADVGLAQLAMHSAFETAGVKDTEALAQLAEHLFV